MAPDDTLMAKAAAGDEAAFSELVARYQARVRGFCAMILHDEALARDVAQDAFLRIWELRERYRPRGRFKELLFTVARNLARKSARRRRLTSLFGLAPAPTAIDDRVDEAVETDQARVLVAAALHRLPEKFRVPLVLRFTEDLSYDEIAAVIGRTPSAARSRVHYGLKALNDLLPEDLRR